MTLISWGIRYLRRVPLLALRGRRTAFTGLTAVAFRTDAQISLPPQNRQMTHGDRCIRAMRLSQVLPTLATLRPADRTLNGDDEMPLRIKFSTQHFYVRYTQRNGDLCFLLLG